MIDIPIHPSTYEALLIGLCNCTKEEAKKIVDKLYIEQYGISREEHRKQIEKEWHEFDWTGRKFKNE